MSAQVFDSILECVGNTPLVRLNKISAGLKPRIYAKLEMMNPGGSVKDRIGLIMIRDAERRGLLKPGGTIIEPTSGNTGCGLAMAAAVLGYKAIFTMPDKVSQEKINLLQAYGARVVMCPTAVEPENPESYYSVSERLAREIPGAFRPNQYENQMNPEAHYRSTGPEIWRQTDGKVHTIVMSMGTGGTISGVGRYIKEQNPKVRIVGADPEGSILCQWFYTKTMGVAHTYKVEGIGEDFIPGAYNFDVIDDIHTIGDKESLETTRRLCREEGILAGGSAGTALAAAFKEAAKMQEDQLLIVLLPDTGERYLSKVHSDEWMRQNLYEGEGVEPLHAVLAAKSTSIPTLISVAPDELVGTAVDRMNKSSLSQLPVIADGRSVGSVMEVSLIRRLHESREVLNLPVREVQEAAFPEVDEYADIEAAFQALQSGHQAVLVTSKDTIKGILTKTDLLHYLRSKNG